MQNIVFIDTEVGRNSIYDIGAVKGNDLIFHSNSVTGLLDFINQAEYLSGHNILKHDLAYLLPHMGNRQLPNIIDTLYLSSLLYPKQLNHSLSKEEKISSADLNNPVNDAIKARELLLNEIETFSLLDESLKEIFFRLLSHTDEFYGFFKFINYDYDSGNDLTGLITDRFRDSICQSAPLCGLIAEKPIELAYSLSLLNSKEKYIITPPWILKSFPEIETVIHKLRGKPCLEGCPYCCQALDIGKGLERYFGYPGYRDYNGVPLQRDAVQAAIDNKSLLAVFPTGGGKSITFQVPALMSGENEKGLTVVISPLQSLMKDQVDNLRKHGISEAATINGLLDPVERQEAFDRVESGRAYLLYISPESLRSRTIEKLLLERKITRFVIDEAHCFSSWGQDFRVDYLYIGDFIRMLQEKKGLVEPIPVSCFTATAKQKVIQDISNYFLEKLDLRLDLFLSTASRTNLRYKVLERENDEHKYRTLYNLIQEKNCPTIVYVSRTRKAEELAERLSREDVVAKAFHGRMDKSDKTKNQDEFIRGEVQVMVATSAFGMGVDKKDVGLVVHFDISDSLENYVQEAGRAGRDESISASCYVLFNEDDLSDHFILLNQTRLHLKEIQQVWAAIKKVTQSRLSVSQSALEIARSAGWDDTVADIETRVITAVSALEEAGYLKRGQNIPHVFANSILSKTAQEAIDKIRSSSRFDDKQTEKATRIIKKLISSRSRKHANEEKAESRIDYISDHLGISRSEVIEIITLLREENILADAKDLTAYIKKGESGNRSREIASLFNWLEIYLSSRLEEQETFFRWKNLQEEAQKQTHFSLSPDKLKTVVNFWAEKGWVKRIYRGYNKREVTLLPLLPYDKFAQKINCRHDLVKFMIDFLYTKTDRKGEHKPRQEELIEFSVLELKERYLRSGSMFSKEVTSADVEEALFYLSRIGALQIEGGFMVLYNQLHIVRLEGDNKKRYKQEDYKKLEQHYNNKIQQIHIVGEYAAKMVEDYQKALSFVDDYFQLNYSSFLQRYFPGKRKDEIQQKITPNKYRELIGGLSPTQLEVLRDADSKHIVVAAGPGSGKTKLLVHKLASLLIMEDVKHEQLLMLTFSRAAASEFRQRLYRLIRNAIGYVEIKTFHSYCFDLLGKVGKSDNLESIVKETVVKVRSGEVELNRITKAVLVIDEAQDMTMAEFELVTALIDKNEDLKVIFVGDDDQNIYSFREKGRGSLPGQMPAYLRLLIDRYDAKQYDLLVNYRSKENLVSFTNQFVTRLKNRLKSLPIVPNQKENGQIRIVRYASQEMVIPFSDDIAVAPLRGSTCVITQTNDEALQVVSLLKQKNLPVKLIQSNDGFRLNKLAELHYFTSLLYQEGASSLIPDDYWEKAKKITREHFARSSQWEICLRIFESFEETYPKKYRLDWDTFISESTLENFYLNDQEMIFVSTIHKAKGKEFDNVFLLLNGADIDSEEVKRKIYVAVTRAKQTLTIHLNGNYLDTISVAGLTRIDDKHIYAAPSFLPVHLYHQDVVLSFSDNKECLIDKLQSGDRLLVTENGCTTPSGNEVVHFSARFRQEIIEKKKQQGYLPTKALINFIVHWTRREDQKEMKIVLPEVIFSLPTE